MEYKGFYILLRLSDRVSYHTNFDNVGNALSISEVISEEDEFYQIPLWAIAEQGTGDDKGQFRIISEPYYSVEEAKEWIDSYLAK
jgi:hypothetical protein